MYYYGFIEYSRNVGDFRSFECGRRLIIGAGIANQSLSIDGLSQSIGTTSSAENSGYSARIKSYQTEIKETVGRIRLVYDQPKFRVF